MKRETSKCLLLNSQIQILKDIFDGLDERRDEILKRYDFVYAVRTDERVVDFINKEAVKVPYSKRTLTLDELLNEIESDEVYNMVTMGKEEINNK